MSESIDNGGSYCPIVVFPPANVTIASNVLSTTGNVIAGNLLSVDGTFTGNLYVKGAITGNVSFTTLNLVTLNSTTVVSQAFFGNGAGISNLNSSNIVGTVGTAQSVTVAAQTNITSVGILTGLNVQGLTVISNGSAISNLNSSNLVGTVPIGLFPTSGATAGTYGSGANVAQVSVDQYGRVTTASNVAIVSSQWTGAVGSPIYYINPVGIGTSTPSANLHVTGNLYVTNAVTTNNVFFNNSILATNLPVVAGISGVYGSGSNVPQVSIDQYGRVTTASNVAIVSSQWTSNAANVTYANGVSIGTLTNPPTGSNLYVLGLATMSNIIVANGYGISTLNSSNLVGTISNSVLVTTGVTQGLYGSGANIGQFTVDQYGRINAASNVVISSVSTSALVGTISVGNLPASGVTAGPYGSSANISQVTVDQYGRVTTASNVALPTSYTAMNVTSANVTTANIVTLNASILATLSNLVVPVQANLVAANVTTLNVSTANVTTANIVTLNTSILATLSRLVVPVQANLVAANVTTANIVTLNTSILATLSNLIVPVQANLVAANVTTLNVTSANVTTANVLDANIANITVPGSFSANAVNTTFFFDTFTIPFIAATQANVASVLNVATQNVLSLNVSTGANITQLTVTTLANISSANLVTANIQTLNVVSSNISILNVNSGANITQLSVTTLANIASANLITSNIQNLNVAVGANITQLSVTTLANIASANVQTENVVTSNILNLNVSVGANITQLSVTSLANISSANLITANIRTENVVTSNIQSLNVSTGANITQLTVTSLANIASANLVTANIQTLNAVFYNLLNLNVSTTANVSQLMVTTLANISSANIVTSNIQTLNAVTSNIQSLNVSTGANITQLTVTSLANIASANLITSNIQSLNVSVGANITQLSVTTLANISSANLVTSNIQSLNAVTSNILNLNVSSGANITQLTVTTQANVATLNVWQVSNLANLTVSNSIASTNNWISGVSKISGTNLPGYMSGIVRYEYSYSSGSMGNQSQIDTLLQGSTQTSNTLVLTTINQASTPFSTANFVWVYIGTIYVSVAGSYTFVTNSDDASDVFIDYPGAMDPRYTTGNATPVSSWYGTHGTGGGGTPGTVTLSFGFHSVMYRLVQGSGGYGAALLWTPPAGISAAIPSTNYFYQTTGRSNLATNSTLEITGDSGASNTALLINSSNVGISVQTGNVGIGTTVPLAPLHIYGPSAIMRLQQSAYPVTGASGDPGIQFSDPYGTVRSYIQYANGSGFLYVGNQIRVYDVGYVLVNYGIVVNNGPFNIQTLTSALSVQGNTYMNGTLQVGTRTYSNLLANSLVNENLFLTKQSLASRNDWGVVSNVQGATITYAGSPYKDANVSAGSAYLSATTYINVASTTSNTNFDWTSSNTCIEAWIWSTNLGATTYIANRGTDFSFYLGGVQLAFSYNGNTYNSGIYLNSQYYQWVHVLFQYDASTSRIYLGVNGTMNNTTKLTSVYTSTLPFYIGSYPVSPLTTAACAISDLRIVRGSTVLPYGTGTTYTVPTGPVGTYSSGTTPLLWPNVNVPAGVVSASQIGIGTSLPNSNLEVYGNAYISNAVTTTNVFATTANVGTLNVWQVSNLSTLSLTNNLYSANALTTTNVFAITATVPGFTSQFTVNGGGTVTYSAAGYLVWTQRVIVIPTWRNAAYAINGWWDITCPTSGTIINNGGTVTCTAAGIPLGFWSALYYRVVPGAGNASVQANFLIKDNNDSAYSPDSNWILLAVRNGDSSEIKWMPGNTTIPLGGTFYTPSASYDKVQVAGTVVVDSARTGIFNNLYSANALTTTNVFVSNGLDVGPGTLGSNVVVFSNISGGANTFIMDSKGRVTIGSTLAGGSLLSFGQTFANKIITLYDLNLSDNPATATAFYGFGIGVNLLRYQTDSAAIHGFYGGATEYARITSTGISILTGGNPRATLDVFGNAYISNALTTTNVFVTTANIQSLNVSTGANITQLTVTTLANISSANLLTANIQSANVVTENVQFVNVSSNLAVFGQSFMSGTVGQSFNLTVAAGAGSFSNICSLRDTPYGSGIYVMYVDLMSRGAGGTAGTKSFLITTNYNLSGGNWLRAIPLSKPGGTNQIGLDVMTSGGTTTLRATRLDAIAEIVNVGLVLRTSSTSFSTVVIADLTAQTGTGATNSGFWPTTIITENNGLAGISTEVPSANLHVTGNIYASNAVSTTNLISTSANLVTANIQTLNVSTGANITYLSVTSLANLASANLVTANVQTLNVVSSNISILNVNSGANITQLSVTSLANIASANLVTSNIQTLNVVSSNTLNLNVATGANITQLSVTTLANLVSANLVTANVQTLNVVSSNIQTLNVSTIETVTQLTALNIYSANSLTTTNLSTAGFTSNASNTIFNYSTLTVPFVFSTTLNAAGTANLNQLTVTTLANIVSANLVTANIQTLNVVSSNISILNVNSGANITQLSVTTLANISSANLITSNIQNLNVATGANITQLSVTTLANISSANLVTANIQTLNVVSSNISILNVNSGANITQLSVTTLANIASANLITSNIQNLNVATGANITQLSVTTLANISSANLVTSNIQTLNAVTSNILNLNVSSGANITQLSVTTLANISSANLITSNILNLNVSTGANITQLSVTTLANISSANLVTSNIQTLNAVTSNIQSLNVSTGANITQLSVTTLANISSSNILTANIRSTNVQTENVVFLNVSTTANVTNLTVTSNIVPLAASGNTYLTGNLIALGNVYTQLGLLGAGGGYYFSLPNFIVTQTPYTGTIGTAYPLSVGLSNGFTVSGTSTMITVTANGNFKFSTAGPYLLNAVFYSGENITGLALGSNAADVHGTDQQYMYRYMTQITQNPTELIEIPFNVTDTSKYYYLDLFATAPTRLYETANTTGGGTYLTITPLTGGGLATGGPGGTPGTQWISSASNIYFSGAVGVGTNPVSGYNLDVSTGTTATQRLVTSNISSLGLYGPTLNVNSNVIITANLAIGGLTAPALTSPPYALTVYGQGYFSNHVSYQNFAGFRNRIVNGTFRVAYRANSITVSNTSVFSVSNTWVCDRWRVDVGGLATSNVLMTVKQDVPVGTTNGFTQCANVYVTRALTGTTGNTWVCPLSQTIESSFIFDFKHGQPSSKFSTFSFYANTSVSGDYSVVFRSRLDNTYFANLVSITAGSWQTYTVYLPQCLIGNWATLSTDGYMDVLIGGVSYGVNSSNNRAVAVTSSWTVNPGFAPVSCIGATKWPASTGLVLQITASQLEEGTIATPFEIRPLNMTTMYCQRFFETNTDIQYAAALGSGRVNSIPYVTTKRNNANVTVYRDFSNLAANTNVSQFVAYYGDGTLKGTQAINSYTGSDYGFTFNFTNTGSKFMDASIMEAQFVWKADAEIY